MNHKKIVGYSVSALALALVGKIWLGSSELPQEAHIPLAVVPEANETQFSELSGQARPVQARMMTESEEVWITEGMKHQMIDVAEAFKENMRYPAYSTPLHSNDWSMLNPRAFVPKMIELDIDGLSAEILVDQYIVDRKKDLPVRVSVQGLDAIDAELSEIMISVGSGGGVISSLISEGKGALTYGVSIPSKSLEKIRDTEVPLSAIIHLSNGEQTQISSVIKLAGMEALLTSLGASYVDGSDLSIPAYFDVSSKGFYRIRANLFDQATNTPISHINASFMLSESENEGTLKVHASTLRSKGFEGPYVLKDFDITRGPAHPGDKTGYGSSSSEEFSVQGFDLNSYSHEPYHDPKNQQRLEFLQKMAGIQ